MREATARTTLGAGWCDEDAVPTPESIFENWEQVMDIPRPVEPGSALEEAALLAAALAEAGR